MFGAVAAVGGSVVGLGNIWRFPYVAGENGGAAFILVYLCVSFLIAVPIMLSEFSIGRSTRRNPYRAFKKLAPGTAWPAIGYMGVFTAFVILSFYSVVAGWALEFLRSSVMGEFAGMGAADIRANFDSFVAGGTMPVIWTLIFVFMTAFIVLSGVEKGIERYTKILMPAMAVLLLGMAINSSMLPGGMEGISFLFRPDFSKISPSVVLQAMGQAFFSLSLGMGAMITYGSYIKKEQNMFKVAGTVALSDLSIAILSGLAIFPAVFAFGVSPTSGPELIFITLPMVFQQMVGGYFISIIFFFLVFVAAITSSISLFEVITAYVSEEMRIPRIKAVAINTPLVMITSVFCALSQMPDSPLLIGGRNLFDIFDNLSSVYLLPIGGLFIVLFAGWVMKPSAFHDELTNRGLYGERMYPAFRVLMRYAIPVVMTTLILFLTGMVL